MKVKLLILVVLTISLIFVSEGNFQAQNARDSFTLTVYKSGNGSGQVYSSPPGIDCGDDAKDCSAAFQRGTPVSLSVRPLHGRSAFQGWSIAVGSTLRCPGARADCNLIIMEDSSIQAEFIVN